MSLSFGCSAVMSAPCPAHAVEIKANAVEHANSNNSFISQPLWLLVKLKNTTGYDNRQTNISACNFFHSNYIERMGLHHFQDPVSASLSAVASLRLLLLPC